MNGEKLTSWMRKYPFQSGIVTGVIACLLLVGFFSLIFSPDGGLSGGDATVREDYLRMTISEFSQNADPDLAAWRYLKLGKSAQSTLKLMEKDIATDPLSLLRFSEVVSSDDVFTRANNTGAQVSGGAQKGLSKFAITFFIALALLILGALILYFWSEHKTAEKKRKRVSKTDEAEERVLRVVSKSDLDRDDYFGSEYVTKRMDDQPEPEVGTMRVNSIPINDVEDLRFLTDDSDDTDAMSDLPFLGLRSADEYDETPVAEAELASADDAVETAQDNVGPEQMKVETQVFQVDDLLKTEDEDEEAQMPAESADTDVAGDELTEQSDSSEPDLNVEEEYNEVAVEPQPLPESVVALDDESIPMAHFQAVYQLGDDLFDETFSLEEGDIYMGECGIGIGETLNNSEPKAVTAFEVWLFDRSDIHTPTHYLLSDFALSNESILERMKQKGAYERIKKNGKMEITTQSLRMLMTVLELDYGSEMNEKNSYFNHVTFDIQIWKK